MFCLNLKATDPFFNLAVDEFLLKNSKDEFLILGINDKSVIIGKHQVAHRESATKFVTQNNIPVIRRISGGGTVFHDSGNLNFSFILKSEQGKQVDFMKYTLPVISFLASLGVDAKFEGKNDLKINGLKISGNAEHVYHDRVLHHGTLLFNSDLDLLRASIRKDTGKYETRAVLSNPSPVMNLKDLLGSVPDISEFRKLMLSWFLKNSPGSKLVQLGAEEINKISEIASSKYRTWDWNYGYGPEYHFARRFQYLGSEHHCNLFVKDGIIRECKIRGSKELEYAGEKLIGYRHMVKDMQDLFLSGNILISGFDIFKFF